MKTEITNIREQSNGYRIDYNQTNGREHTSVVNSLVTFKELIEFVDENALNVFHTFNEDSTDMEETILHPQTYIEENYATVIQRYLEVG